MTKIKIATVVLAMVLLASTHCLAGGMNEAMVSAPCAGCHGANGASSGPGPIIGGLPKPYLMETMMNYKTDQRYSTVMGRIAKGYRPGQLSEMADFFAEKPWVPAKQEIDAALAEEGKRLHAATGCMACHGRDGISASPTTPRLAGQYSEYLVNQMVDYQTPGRTIPATALPMRAVLQGLSVDELNALAHFYASQRP